MNSYIINIDNKRLKYGTRVEFDYYRNIGTGKIVGVGNFLALIGYEYIVELDKPIPDWAYTHISVLEEYITVISDDVENDKPTNEVVTSIDGYSCPTCSEISSTETLLSETEELFFVFPTPHYEWTEQHLCDKCATKYSIECLT